MKAVSKLAWILIAFVLAISIGGFFAYWFFVMGGGAGGFFSKQQCQMTFTTACEDYKSAGYPGEMRIRTICRDGKPEACCDSAYAGGDCLTITGIGWQDCYTDISSWWDCIAPGCRQSYYIKIDSEADCGAAQP